MVWWTKRWSQISRYAGRSPWRVAFTSPLPHTPSALITVQDPSDSAAQEVIARLATKRTFEAAMGALQQNDLWQVASLNVHSMAHSMLTKCSMNVH
jgi:hypothetical protein